MPAGKGDYLGALAMSDFRITTHVVDIHQRRIEPAEVMVEHGRITRIVPHTGPVEGYLIPGFVDAHVHVESSMLTPAEFARVAVTHGTVGTVSDPHEIANVLGVPGVEYMIDNGRQVPFHFCFGAPSCVPATAFETAGATIDADAIGRLLERPEIGYLAEVMDFPGVLNGAPQVMAKIAHAHRLGKPVDGHAPGLHGELARRYIAAGIHTDHECFTREEAVDKLAHGMHILIREGSAARNFEALIDLLHDHPDRIMFCTDDMHPDSLLEGHLDRICARAVHRGHDVFHVLRAASLNPIRHYRLPVGLLRVGDPADMVLVDDLHDFKVRRTWVRGRLVAEDGRTLIPPPPVADRPNNFARQPVTLDQLHVPATTSDLLVIGALDGQLITTREHLPATVRDGACVADPAKDLLKIAVVDRYQGAPPAVSWITGFGLKQGAVASSVAHDSHNIVAVGTNDADLCAAINAVVEQRGGISLACGDRREVLPLPVAGIMSDADGPTVAHAYARLDRAAKALGSTLAAPYMTLSFMALPVIPHLKITDRGLFDVDAFRLVSATA
jgi:adenine deaminase